MSLPARSSGIREPGPGTRLRPRGPPSRGSHVRRLPSGADPHGNRYPQAGHGQVLRMSFPDRSRRSVRRVLHVPSGRLPAEAVEPRRSRLAAHARAVGHNAGHSPCRGPRVTAGVPNLSRSHVLLRLPRTTDAAPAGLAERASGEGLRSGRQGVHALPSQQRVLPSLPPCGLQTWRPSMVADPSSDRLQRGSAGLPRLPFNDHLRPLPHNRRVQGLQLVTGVNVSTTGQVER